SLFAISYLGSVYCLVPARYHEINRLRTTLSLSLASESPSIRCAIIVEGSLSPVSNCVPFVAIGSHLYRRCIFPIMPATRMHMRSPRMAYEAVLYDLADCICTITLNRPEKLNAWTRQMHLDLK